MNANFGRAHKAAPCESGPHLPACGRYHTDTATTAVTPRPAQRTARQLGATAMALSCRILIAATLMVATTHIVDAQATRDTTHYIDTVGMGGRPLRTHADSVRAQQIAARRDSLARIAVRLGAVTITSTPVQPSEPIDVVRVTPSIIAETPSNSPLELLRETAGVEAHEQGQGPGFPSDMSIRGFSSDHSTDIALWIDGVPINEPVNGHAEGLNDFEVIFPEVVSGIDVIKGPTSALYGNFAFSGVVNVRTLDRIDNTQLDIAAGNYGDYQGVLLTGFDHGSTAGMLGIRATHDDGWRTHSENQLGQLHGRLEHDLSDKTTLDFGLELYATTYNSPGFLDTLSYLQQKYNVVSNFGDGGFKRRGQERASVRTILTRNLEWRTTLYGIEDTWNFWLSTPPGLGGLLEGSGVETREYDGRYGGGATSALTYTSEHVNITAGGEGRYDYSNYNNWGEYGSKFRTDSVPFGITEAHQSSGGMFVQSDFDVTRFLRFDLGGRVDQLSSYAHTPSAYNYGTTPDAPYYSLGPYADVQHSKGILFAEDWSVRTRAAVGGSVRQRLAGVASGRRGHLRPDGALHHALELRDGDQTGASPVVARCRCFPNGPEQRTGLQRRDDHQRRTQRAARRGRHRTRRDHARDPAVDEYHDRRCQVHAIPGPR